MRVATVNQHSSGDTDRTVPFFLAKCGLIQDYRLRNGHFTRQIHLAYSVELATSWQFFLLLSKMSQQSSFETASALFGTDAPTTESVWDPVELKQLGEENREKMELFL